MKKFELTIFLQTIHGKKPYVEAIYEWGQIMKKYPGVESSCHESSIWQKDVSYEKVAFGTAFVAEIRGTTKEIATAITVAMSTETQVPTENIRLIEVAVLEVIF